MTKVFSIKQIAQIAIKVRQHKKLIVTTEGQMFPAAAQSMAEEAVRVKNMILEDQNDYVGIVTLTEDQFTDARLKGYAADASKFTELFKDARIPVSRKKEEFVRKPEAPTVDDKEVVDSVSATLGLTKKATKKVAEPEKPVEVEAEVEAKPKLVPPAK